MNQSSNWLGWLLAIVAIILVAGGGTYFGLRYFFGNASVQTYQQCVMAGGVILESYPRQCQINTSNGPVNFTEPIDEQVAIPDESNSFQPVVREPSLEAQATAQGKKIRYHDEVGFKIITPASWSEQLEFSYGGSENRAPAFYPALQVGPGEDLGEETRVITFSQPLDPQKATVGPAAFIANGLESIPSAPQLQEFAEAFQSVESEQTTVGGQPAVIISRQVINNLSEAPTGFCAGCWQKRVYIELPDGDIIEVSANWTVSQTSFESEFDQVLQSFQLLDTQPALPPTP